MAGLRLRISSASSTSATSVMRSAPRSNAMAAVVNARNTSITNAAPRASLASPSQTPNPYFHVYPLLVGANNYSPLP